MTLSDRGPTGPRHTAAGRVVESGLFDAVSTFGELERRISSLPTEGERGTAFEVFAEAYLATQAIIQAEEVWPFAATPPSVRRALRLGDADLGVDGIVKSHLGEFQAYQVKFRSGRPALTWTQLSTFLGLADYVPHRILFTNCDDIADILEKRRGFYCIRGSDLDRLEASHFAALLGWLQYRPIPPPKKTPRPDQHEAIAAICDGLRANDRVTAVMACGTGKTLVQLWSAERLGCRRILVLVPSLALLRQTLHQWLQETSWRDLSYLAVCSDPTVKPEEDSLSVRQGDLDFPVTTDSATVRQFFARASDGVQIVFSTYHSAPVVAEGCPDGQAFDLAAFDEAHWTAGREGQRFAFALTETHLNVRKRLFVTATPRHYAAWRRDKYGDLGLVYSMDQPETYGPRVYTLSFANAERQGIICNYKVIISVVTSAMVTEELLRRGEVIVQGDLVQARQVANQIALREAVDQAGAYKIITFHGTVRSAESFTSMNGEGIHNHLPEFQTYHVNGAMRAKKRDDLLAEFREALKAVMSNARCLTEGMDVPAVDMVAFLAPKRSRVDIVQATGRAMRTAPGKTTGYVFLPLYIQETAGESVEEALARADFEEVWNVLQALQEQDEVLADIIREMREAQGRTGGYDDSRFREKVQVLGPALSLDVLQESIATRCIERLAAYWDYMYGKLVAFKNTTRHCNVPDKWKGNPQLAHWVGNQRQIKKRGSLSSDRIQRLNALSFEWDPKTAAWEEMFNRLVRYKETAGNCNVPQQCPEDQRLASWVSTQRQGKRCSHLSPDQIQRLDALGFVWNARTALWEEMFNRLVQYKARFHDCNVPINWEEDPQLARWVFTQRQSSQRGLLSSDRRQRLAALGFDLDPHASDWEEMFNRLVRYKEHAGDCKVPQQRPEDQQLARWVNKQRQLGQHGELSLVRHQRLATLGFEWDPQRAAWEEMCDRLVAFKNREGHCLVRRRWAEDPSLALWVNRQRYSKRRGWLSSDRVQRLDALGLEWDVKAAAWEEMFTRLIKYRERVGHCNVPRNWSEDRELSNWVHTQRRFNRLGHLSADHVQRLDMLGFEWEVRLGSRRSAHQRRRTQSISDTGPRGGSDHGADSA